MKEKFPYALSLIVYGVKKTENIILLCMQALFSVKKREKIKRYVENKILTLKESFKN